MNTASRLQDSGAAAANRKRAMSMLEQLYKSQRNSLRRAMLQSLGLGDLAQELTANPRLKERLDEHLFLLKPVSLIDSGPVEFDADALITVLETGVTAAATELGLGWYSEAVANALVSGQDGFHRSIATDRVRLTLKLRGINTSQTETVLPTRDVVLMEGVTCLKVWAKTYPEYIQQMIMSLIEEVTQSHCPLAAETLEHKTRLELTRKWINLTRSLRAIHR